MAIATVTPEGIVVGLIFGVLLGMCLARWAYRGPRIR